MKSLSKDVTLAEVEWDRPGLPERINVKYLVQISRIAFDD